MFGLFLVIIKLKSIFGRFDLFTLTYLMIYGKVTQNIM